MNIHRATPGGNAFRRDNPRAVVSDKGKYSPHGRQTSALVDVDMAVGPQNGAIAPGTVCKKGDKVALCPGGYEKSGLMPRNGSRFKLQFIDSRVFTVNIVSNFGRCHRGTHFNRRFCYRIASKIDQIHCYACLPAGIE